MAFPMRYILNTQYCRDNILAELTQFQPEDAGRKLIVRADNVVALNGVIPAVNMFGNDPR
jgi:hypothetical protein